MTRISTSVSVKGFGVKLVNVRGFVASWATQPLKVFAGSDIARQLDGVVPGLQLFESVWMYLLNGLGIFLTLGWIKEIFQEIQGWRAHAMRRSR